ncbi:YdcF family protein [Aerococcus urinae]|uniref:YdcF family protein n=1 Tax=Aerococcus urinae TaxID=1376 RepID=A0A0X8FF77_9LACT|nr:YdcF family protein [Aerococcus urinae]AMB96177.1 hypothetical protein AWM73_06480 [Aerococcus urinae]MCY3033220.1 YdcF family protein [Aerococcus urinae]MCY3038617.1 YdcF family protein [Aerococcus urinae]MCY3045338.1 YdcF family protein [Aerococcus urinae]MCY3047075.1 YdcF family protein [Aerococcus urinae]
MKRRWLTGLSLGALLGLGLRSLYKHLDHGQAPQVSELIIVAEGPAVERAEKAVHLLKAGYSRAEKIIVSPRYTDVDEDLFAGYQQLGAERENLIEEKQATSTWTNATTSLALMDDLGYHSAIVVTSDYHMRRTRLAFERANRNYGFQLNFVSAYFQGESYPNHPYTQNMALQELYKYIGYCLHLYHWIDL